MSGARKIIVGVSGLEASFSEEAAVEYAKKNNLGEIKLKYLVSVERVLRGIDRGEIELGIFPIENSNAGVVYEAIEAMANHIFKIEKLFEIEVKHCLITKPRVRMTTIKKIASHDQALRQCRSYLSRTWPEATLIEWDDTAKAAKDLAEGKLKNEVAVIAPKRAADLYGLRVVEEGIQDLKFNFTAFLAVTA